MAISSEKRNLTVEEYLEMEKGARERREYCAGASRMMGGARRSHNLIVQNLLLGIRQTNPFLFDDLGWRVTADTVFAGVDKLD